MRTMITVALTASVLLLTSPMALARVQAGPPAAAQKAALDLNTATLDQLETLPGVGRKTAERIIEHRQKSGGFKKIEELMNVKGIGEKSFLKIKPLIAVAPRAEKAGGAA